MNPPATTDESSSEPQLRLIRAKSERQAAPKFNADIDAVIPDARQRRSWSWLGWLTLAGIAFASGRFMAGSSHPIHQIGLEGVNLGTTERGDAIVVTAEPVRIREIQRTVDAVGTLHGFEELTISSKLEGRVARILHDLSSVVKPGELLLQLDETDAKLSVEQAERSLQAELSKWGFKSVPQEQDDLSGLPMVVSSKLKFDLSKSRLDRMLPLQASQSISVDDLEQAKSDTRVFESEWKNQLLMAQSAAATARLRAADLAIAQQRLLDCEIRVPTPSLSDRPDEHQYTVSERLVSEGTLLRPGTELFRLVLGSTLKLRLSIPESHSSKIEVGQRVTVSTTSMGEPRDGRVAKISPAIDRATRTFIVEVEVPNEDRRCKPGSFAKASILVGTAEPALTIPMSGLYSLAGVNKLFLIDGGTAREHEVTLGEQTRDWVEITSPSLSPNARVVTSGQRMLSEGVPIVERAISISSGARTAGAAASPVSPKEARP